MGQTELTLVIGSALVVAVVVGWTLRWIFAKMNTSGPMASAEVTGRMREAEAAQEAAEAQLAEVTENARRMESQLNAELEAAMSGLGNARREAEAWREEAEAWRTETEEIRHDQEEQQD